MLNSSLSSLFFFFNDPATTEIYTLSLHDALPISMAAFDGLLAGYVQLNPRDGWDLAFRTLRDPQKPDRKSTRLNSSHVEISYAVFCLKKKKKKKYTNIITSNNTNRSSTTNKSSRC